MIEYTAKGHEEDFTSPEPDLGITFWRDHELIDVKIANTTTVISAKDVVVLADMLKAAGCV